MKRQSTELDKIFVSHVPDKGLISKIYKELILLNDKRDKQFNFKMNRGPEQICFQEDIEMTNRCMKRCSTNHKGNTSQNHNEISPHTHYKSYDQENKK